MDTDETQIWLTRTARIITGLLLGKRKKAFFYTCHQIDLGIKKSEVFQNLLMKRYFLFVGWGIFIAANAFGQVTNALPGRSIIKLLPDYVHPRVLALNQANGSEIGRASCRERV